MLMEVLKTPNSSDLILSYIKTEEIRLWSVKKNRVFV